MQPASLTPEQKRDLAERRFYLDGLPARLVGILNDWPTIRQTCEPYNSALFSWLAVQRIAENRGGYASST